jgi:uncharacterized protein (TIGR02147 family)
MKSRKNGNLLKMVLHNQATIFIDMAWRCGYSGRISPSEHSPEVMSEGCIVMINIFDYFDYRQFLKDFYEAEKKLKPYFSYRFISSRVSLNPGYLVKLFQGKIHLGVSNIPAFITLMNLNEKESDYFTELVHFGRAKRQDEIEQRFERLQSIKGVRFRTMADDAVEFYRQWYYMVVRVLISIYPFDGRNYKQLASRLTPPITVKEAREAVVLLERMKLIEKGADGVYHVTDQYVSSGDKWSSAVIRNYQKKNMELALQSLENQSKDFRDISTVTMTLATKDLPIIRERIKQFRQELLLLSRDSTGEDAVFHFNIQLFPVALCNGEEQ